MHFSEAWNEIAYLFRAGKKRRTRVSVFVRVEGSSKTRVPGEIEVFSVLLCKTGTSWALFTHSICRGLKKIIYSAFRELINQFLAAQSIPQLWGNQLSEPRKAAAFTFQLSWIFLVGPAWENLPSPPHYLLRRCAETADCMRTKIAPSLNGKHQGHFITSRISIQVHASHLPSTNRGNQKKRGVGGGGGCGF